jgi:hypothetical protein
MTTTVGVAGHLLNYDSAPAATACNVPVAYFHVASVGGLWAQRGRADMDAAFGVKM